jgi:hypothetical protein
LDDEDDDQDYLDWLTPNKNNNGSDEKKETTTLQEQDTQTAVSEDTGINSTTSQTNIEEDTSNLAQHRGSDSVNAFSDHSSLQNSNPISIVSGNHEIRQSSKPLQKFTSMELKNIRNNALSLAEQVIDFNFDFTKKHYTPPEAVLIFKRENKKIINAVITEIITEKELREKAAKFIAAAGYGEVIEFPLFVLVGRKETSSTSGLNSPDPDDDDPYYGSYILTENEDDKNKGGRKNLNHKLKGLRLLHNIFTSLQDQENLDNRQTYVETMTKEMLMSRLNQIIPKLG